MSASAPTGFVATARLFLSDVGRFRPRLLALSLLLMLLRSLSEGFSYLLLLPLLSLSGTISGREVGEAVGGGERLIGVLPTFIGGLGLAGALGLFVALMLSRALLGYASSVAASAFASSFVEHVRLRLYLALSRASWLHLTATRQAHDAQALTEQADGTAATLHYVVNLAAAALTIATGLCVALAISPRLTLVVLAAGLLLAPPMVVFQRWAVMHGSAMLRSLQGLYEAVLARMGGLKLAKAFAIERELEREFEAASSTYQRAVLASETSAARATLIQEIATVALLTVMVWAALGWLRMGALDLVLMILIFARLAPLANGVVHNLRSVAGLLPSYRALREREMAAVAAEEALSPPGCRLPLRDRVELDGVEFAYESDGAAWGLRDVSLTIPAGSAMGLIGLSGAGKSTLVDIVCGLIRPHRGAVRVDGVALDDTRRAMWRASVAYVPQDAPLFHASLRDNLRIAAREAPDEDIWRTLEDVGVADLVRRLPAGLDTLAGDRGARLSGGERQRIRLASALLCRPRFLVLDESTSALNPADEAAIIAGLQRRRADTTFLVIAHRASSIAWTDRVIVMRDGRIAAEGPPGEVLAGRDDVNVGDSPVSDLRLPGDGD